MKINIIKIIIVITVIIWWMGMAGTAGAVIKRAGEIEVITDEPLFTDSIVWYPGLRVEKSFQVKNRGRGVKTGQIEAENETETGQLAGVLRVRINEGNRGIYGVSESKTLRNFFDYGAIALGEVFGDDSGKTFSMAVTMPAGAGNEYQGARVKFDLRIGFAGEGSSSVTVAGKSTGVLGKSGISGEIEGGEGLEGGRQILGKSGEREETEVIEGEREEEREGKEGKEESGISGGSGGSGEMTWEGINWGFLAIIGGLLVSGGLAAGMWLRLRGK